MAHLLVFIWAMVTSWWFWGSVLVILIMSKGDLDVSFFTSILFYGIGSGLVWTYSWITGVASLGGFYNYFSSLHIGVPLEVVLAGIVGSMFFWPVAFVIILFLLGTESEWWAGTVLVLLGLLWFVVSPAIDWKAVAWYTMWYFIVGFAFTFVKYWFYSRKRGRNFREYAKDKLAIVAEYGTDKGKPRYSKEEVASQWADKILNVTYDTERDRWKTGYHKANFVGYASAWTVFWPMYAALILLEDFVKEAWEWILENFGGAYRRISDAAFNVAG